jgi:hypothetical protein
MTVSPERLLNVTPPLSRNPPKLPSLPFRILPAVRGDV